MGGAIIHKDYIMDNSCTESEFRLKVCSYTQEQNLSWILCLPVNLYKILEPFTVSLPVGSTISSPKDIRSFFVKKQGGKILHNS